MSKNFDLAEKTNYLIEELADHDYGTLPDIVFLQVASAIMTKECSKKDILQLNKRDFIETWETVEDAIRSAVDYLRTSLLVPVSQLLTIQSPSCPYCLFLCEAPCATIRRHAGSTSRLFLACLPLRSVFTFIGDTTCTGRPCNRRYTGREDNLYMTIQLNRPKNLSQYNGTFNAGRSFIKAVLCCLAGKRPLSFKNNGLGIHQ